MVSETSIFTYTCIFLACDSHVLPVVSNFKLVRRFKSPMVDFNSMSGIVRFFRVEQEIQRALLTGQIQTALKLYDDLLAIKSRYPNRLGYAKTLSEKAFLLESHGFAREALDTYSLAARITNSSANPDFHYAILRKMERLSF